MPRKLKSSALRSDAVTVANIPNGEITAAKLHDTAIQDKLGYVPASAATVASQLATLVDSAPTTLDTLNELAAALGDDANFATTITTALGTKANTSSLGSLASLNTVSTSQIDNGSVTLSKLGSNAVFLTQFNARTSQHTLVGDSGWVDHVSITFTTTAVCNCLFIYSSSSSFESGTVQGFARLILDGTMIGYNSAVAKQSTANAAGAGTCIWDRQAVSIGTHTIKVQLRNTSGTWITPYWSADGQTANTLGVLYYA